MLYFEIAASKGRHSFINLPNLSFLKNALSKINSPGIIKPICKDEFLRNVEPKFNGSEVITELPEDWFEICDERLNWSGIYVDCMGHNEDLHKFVNDELDPQDEQHVSFVLEYMDRDIETLLYSDSIFLYNTACS